MLDAGADPIDQRSGFTALHVLTWVRKPNSGDDDGFVDFVAIVYALPCRSNVRAGAIWPHRAAMSPFESTDIAHNGGNIKVADYVILPAVDQFAPELLIVSAGFDAHLRDPLAQLRLVETDFAWITEQMMEVAAKHCGGKLVSSLEGGYDLEALASSTATHVQTLMGAAS